MAINFLSQISALAGINLNQKELVKAQIENQPNDAGAGTGVEGQIYYDTTLDVLKVWAGGSWKEVGGGVTSFTATDGTFIDLTPNNNQIGDAVLSADLSATGTPSSATFLRGDNVWATPVDINTTYDLAGGGTTNGTAKIVLTGTDSTIDNIGFNGSGITLVTQSGNVITIGTVIPSNHITFAMLSPAAVVVASETIGSNNNDTTLPTSAAVKAYVDSSVAGGLVYQGAYNATTNTPNLDTTSNIAISKGFTYTVTVDGLFFTEQVRVGDVIIANVNIPANSASNVLSNFTTVQNNVDIANSTTIGLGNVNAGTGISVSYTNGTALVSNTDLGSSQAIFKNIAVSGQGSIVADNNNDTLTVVGGTGITVTTNATTDTLTINSDVTSFSNTGPAAAGTSYTITSATHGLGANSSIIMVQLLIVATGASGLITITFAASQPINTIRALLQKIG
jgi:hypothetical protein